MTGTLYGLSYVLGVIERLDRFWGVEFSSATEATTRRWRMIFVAAVMLSFQKYVPLATVAGYRMHRIFNRRHMGPP
jgi:hypothetical protein